MKTNWKLMEETILNRLSNLEVLLKANILIENYEECSKIYRLKLITEKDYISKALKFKNFNNYLKKINYIIDRKV